jgi:hypothetical protein
MRDVGGVPLLLRVIRTAVRAGAESAVVIWPSSIPLRIWMDCQEALLQEGMTGITLVSPDAYDPRKLSHWTAIAPLLKSRLLWLPWNWVTSARALAELAPMAVLPSNWNSPHLLLKQALNRVRHSAVCFVRAPEGIAVLSAKTAIAAERFNGTGIPVCQAAPGSAVYSGPSPLSS